MLSLHLKVLQREFWVHRVRQADSQTQKLKQLMLASTKPAYFVMSNQMHLIEWSENLSDYGYENLRFNCDASNIFNFIVGYEVGETLDLPILTTPNGVAASISILPEGDLTNVLIMDASYDFQTQFRLQQKANEAELLGWRQRQLMKQLLATQKELAKKNRLLEESSRLQTRFLSGVSHEFRTPLTSVIGYSDALHEILSGEEQKKVSIIQSSAKYLLSLVENLLDHGRLDAQALDIQPKPIQIVEFINTMQLMMEPVAQQKSIALECQSNVVEKVFYFDETRVRQCIINIVNNAIKFTDKGSVKLNCDWQDGELVIQVVDSGIGMSESDRENLFVSFWQSKNHDRAGAGLGLTITKRILDRMGGEILISSKLGKGTTIEMKFPAPIIDDEALFAGNELALTANSTESQRSAKILLVEDDTDIADLVMTYLIDWGFDAHRVTNGQLAIEWFENDDTLDLVLMDMNMPILGGGETIRRLRHRGVTTPIYIMSATGIENIEDDELEKMIEGHLLKPVDFELLNELLTSTFQTA